MRAGFVVVSVMLCLLTACDDSSYPFQLVEDTVAIQYSLDSAGSVDVIVANDCMYTVRLLVNSVEQNQGPQSVEWDLMDDGGEYPGDGLYTVEIYLNGLRSDVQVLEVNRQ